MSGWILCLLRLILILIVRMKGGRPDVEVDFSLPLSLPPALALLPYLLGSLCGVALRPLCCLGGLCGEGDEGTEEVQGLLVQVTPEREQAEAKAELLLEGQGREGWGD